MIEGGEKALKGFAAKYELELVFSEEGIDRLSEMGDKEMGAYLSKIMDELAELTIGAQGFDEQKVFRNKRY